MVFSEKGMALVNVVVILTVLLTLAQVLSQKIWMSTRQVSQAGRREKILWAAQSGIETARARLARTYASSLAWKNYLTSNAANSYPAVPVWTTHLSDITVDLFLRDNADGDQDDQTDNDLKIFVLSRARNALGQEAVVEALCGMEQPGSHRFSGGSGRSLRHVELSEASTENFRITE